MLKGIGNVGGTIGRGMGKPFKRFKRVELVLDVIPDLIRDLEQWLHSWTPAQGQGDMRELILQPPSQNRITHLLFAFRFYFSISSKSSLMLALNYDDANFSLILFYENRLLDCQKTLEFFGGFFFCVVIKRDPEIIF